MPKPENYFFVQSWSHFKIKGAIEKHKNLYY